MPKYPTNLENVRSSAPRERAAKIAVLIAEYLKIHTLGAGPRKLEEVILKEHPEWEALRHEPAGALSTQTRLTNDIGWAKNALRDGGYTTSKKEATRGGKEVLKLTDKGRTSDFTKPEQISWEQHFVVIQEGRI